MILYSGNIQVHPKPWDKSGIRTSRLLWDPILTIPDITWSYWDFGPNLDESQTRLVYIPDLHDLSEIKLTVRRWQACNHFISSFGSKPKPKIS